MSFYGCAIWDLSSPSIKSLDVGMNKVLRRIWSLPYNSHTGIPHVVSNRCSVYNNPSQSQIFSQQTRSCGVFSFVFNYIGYNNKYGLSFMCNYTCSDYAIARLISEIRDDSIYVPSFNCCILDHMARVASSN